MTWVRRSGVAPSSSPVPLPDKIWQIIFGRGYSTKESIEALLRPQLKSLAHPYTLDHMKEAVDRLLRALQAEEKILIYGDYDLDGTPGLALLQDGLLRLGFKRIDVFQPSRLKQGYGLHSALMEEFKRQGVQLIVTVDVGITDVEAVRVAKDLGMDVIVTDHHLPKEELPPAVAIINPNKGDCGSRLQHLCGAGVAFYLILALRMEMSRLGLLQNDFNPKELLDLFSIATITDMVPLVGENRVLVKHGLLQLADTKRPGLKRLFQELGFYGKKLSAQDVAFRIAPKLNALTRLDEGVRALDVLLANEESAPSLVSEALIINQRRVQLQEKAKRVAESLIRAKDVSSFVWIYSHEFHPGVISLVANDLMSELGVPAFVGAIYDGRIVGSARAPSGAHNLQDALAAAKPALNRYGGHQMAAGFEVEESNQEKVGELLGEYFARAAEPQERGAAPSYVYDAEVSLSDLDENFMNWYESLGPFGMQFEVPLLLLRGVNVQSRRKLKGKFLKYVLSDGVKTLEAPWFSGAVEFTEGSLVDVLFEPKWNEYNGRRSIQAMITDMKYQKSYTLDADRQLC